MFFSDLLELYLGCYRSKLIVTEKVELSLVRITAEVKSFVPINCKSQNPQEEHAHRTKKQGVELTNHSWRPKLKIRGTIKSKKVFQSHMNVRKYHFNI